MIEVYIYMQSGRTVICASACDRGKGRGITACPIEFYLVLLQMICLVVYLVRLHWQIIQPVRGEWKQVWS